MLSHRAEPSLSCPTTTGSRPCWLLIAVAVVVLTLAAATRLYQLDKPLWLDELHTSWAARGNWSEVAQRARDGNQPPVYFWLCHVVTQGTGGGEVRLRLPSLLASLLLLPAAWWLLRRMAGSWTAGLVAGYLLAIDPIQIVFAQEARVYALVQLVTLLHVGVFALVTTDARWPRRLALILLTVLLFYLHYTSLLVLTGELVWYVLARRWKAGNEGGTSSTPEGGPSPYTAWKLAADLAVALVGTLPGWGALGEVYGRREVWRQIMGPVRVSQLFTQFNWLTLVAPACVVAAGAWFIQRRWARANNVPPSDEPHAELSNAAWAGLLACWFLVPLLLVWMATAAGLLSLMLPRYLLIIAPVPALAAGWLTTFARHPGLRIASVLAVCLWATLQTSPPYGYVREDWRAAIATIEAQERSVEQEGSDDMPDAVESAPVVLWAALVEGGDRDRLERDQRFREYLLFPLQGHYRFERARPLEPLANAAPDKLLPGLLTDRQRDSIRSHGSAWIIYRAWQRDVSEHADTIGQQLAEPGDTWQATTTKVGPLVVVRLTRTME